MGQAPLGMPVGMDEQERGRVVAEEARVREAEESDRNEVEDKRSEADRKRALELSPALREAEGTRLQKELRAQAVVEQERARAEAAAKAKPEVSAERAAFDEVVAKLRARVVGLQLRPDEARSFSLELDRLEEWYWTREEGVKTPGRDYDPATDGPETTRKP